MAVRYASMRQVLPALNITVTPGAGNLTGSGSLYIAYQGRNRAGYNLPTVPQQVTYNAGDRIDITIPAIARATGEDIYLYAISASLSEVSATLQQLGEYQGYSFSPPNGIGLNPLPATISLSEDEHLKLDATVPDEVSLPAGAALLPGMLRGVSAYAQLYRYDAISTAEVDSANHTVLAAVGGPGRWIRFGSRSTYLTNPEDPNQLGADAPVQSVSDASVIQPPGYPANGQIGYPTDLYWLSDINQIVQAGCRFNLDIFLASVNRTQAASGKFKFEILGAVDLTTGELDTTFASGERTFRAGKAGAYILPADLPAGYALKVRSRPCFSADEFNGDITNGLQIKISVRKFVQAGDYIGGVVRNLIYEADDRRRIVPGSGLEVIALTGEGTVEKVEFSSQPETPVGGLELNKTGQKILINADGVVYARPSIYTVQSDRLEALRAVVDTAAGRSAPGPWSTYQSVPSGATLDTTLTHPTDGTNATVRVNYPDTRIAGSIRAKLPLGTLVIYLQRLSDGEIREFTGSLAVDASTQEVAIDNWSSGAVIVAPSDPPAADFGLMAPGAASIASTPGASDFIADDYRVAFAYEYDGAQVTTITHDPALGCIKEAGAPFENIFEALKTFPLVVANPTQARQLQPEQLTLGRSVIINSRLPNPYYWWDPTSTETDTGLDDSPALQPHAIAGSGRLLPLFATPWSQLARLDASQMFVGAISGNQIVLMDGETISIDASQANAYKIVLDQAPASRTISNPTSVPGGHYYLMLELVQPPAGAQSITTWGSVFDFGESGAPMLSTAGDVADLLSFQHSDGKFRFVGIQRGFTI